MDNTREIKVYGTLTNNTVDTSIGDTLHNDKLAYARQLYDDQFGETPAVQNFLDNINKRVKKIKAGSDGSTIVDGDLQVNGDLIVNGQPVDLADLAALIADVAALKAIWKIEGGYIVPASSVNQVKAAAYYDTSVN